MAKYIERANAGEKFPLLDAYPYLQEHGFMTDVENIKNSKDYLVSGGKEYTTTDLRRGRIIVLLQKNNLLKDFMARHWPFGETIEGVQKMNGYIERLNIFNKVHGKGV